MAIVELTSARRPDRHETPIRRQYEELKQQHPDCVLLFQLGDFFECFEEDARLVSRTCGIALTSREFGKGDRVALAGVPLGRLDTYLARLMEAGLHVAVAEQVSPPGSGLVERTITRVVTPGTLVEPGLLRDRENRYLAAVVRSPARPDGRGLKSVGLACVDVSTGDLATTQLSGEDCDARLRSELERLAPAELLVPEGEPPPEGVQTHVTSSPAWHFAEAAARERICQQFDVRSLAGFGCEGLAQATGAVGALLAYLEAHDRRLLRSLAGVRTYTAGRGMTLDQATRRNLELVRGARPATPTPGAAWEHGRGQRAEGSLLATLDRTRSPMGGRLLRAWLSEPLLDVAEIDARLDGVAALYEARDARAAVGAALARSGDLERRLGRITRGVAGPRDLLELADGLRAVRDLRERLVADDLPALRAFVSDLDACPELVDLVDRAIAPPGSGRTIRAGFDPDLDEVVESMAMGRQHVAALEDAERRRTGIKSLKVGFNRVFGYYLEVSRPNLALVPDDYQRRQTLASAERFVTPALKAFEARIQRAEARVADLERDVYQGVLDAVARDAPTLRRGARALAHLDVLAGLAERAQSGGYCRPTLVTTDELRIVAGRHPVVEASLEPGAFIPNDCHLGADEQRIALVTGPNMAGKSTYLRQVALIVLMAQIGSFVPAREATIGVVDRIFTRVGAHDDLVAGASTFMVEMSEAANILRHASARSLVVLDEIGRGTSTYDGLSIAQAIMEDLHDRVGARTLFATHFHELIGVAASLPRVRVLRTAVAEDQGRIVFLRRLEPGGCDRSYGIQVARLAGLSAEVTARAEQVLGQLERSRPVSWEPVALEPADRPMPGEPVDPPAPRPADPPAAAGVVDELLAIDLATTTPLQALNALAALQRRARRAGG
jgi:DNA mismatch repair protein MutS